MDYSRQPAGLFDLIELPPIDRWSRFDEFMWHAGLVVQALARLAVIVIACWLVAR